MARAILVKSLTGWTGEACLYRVDPPIGCWETEKSYEYVVISATVAYSGPETFIFGSDSQGNVDDFEELPGSRKGTLSHSKILEELGYNIEQHNWPLKDKEKAKHDDILDIKRSVKLE